MQTNLIQLATLFSLVIANLASGASPARDSPLTPVSLDKVEIDDGFWRQRLDTHFESTLDHVLDQCRETGRLHNFEVLWNHRMFRLRRDTSTRPKRIRFMRVSTQRAQRRSTWETPR
jgi:hypothetical protein